MIRKTKIIATIGPSTSSKEMLSAIMKKGVNVCRLNFSHLEHSLAEKIICDIKELNKAREVSKTWRYSANYCLSIFREINYKLPHHIFTDIEKQMLQVNAKYLPGHSKYLLALLSNSFSDETTPRSLIK